MSRPTLDRPRPCAPSISCAVGTDIPRPLPDCRPPFLEDRNGWFLEAEACPARSLIVRGFGLPENHGLRAPASPQLPPLDWESDPEENDPTLTRFPSVATSIAPWACGTVAGRERRGLSRAHCAATSRYPQSLASFPDAQELLIPATILMGPLLLARRRSSQLLVEPPSRSRI
jgi:hypothetical protein